MLEYRTHVFDMDGVLLASNGVKSRAFREAALPYGAWFADRMVEFHQQAGSMSRRERWERFFSEILHKEPDPGELERVIEDCTAFVRAGMRMAPKVRGVEAYLRSLAAVGRVVVTGVLTAEAQGILEDHGLAGYFTHIYGGPRRKGEVLKRLVGSGTIGLPAVYYGDTLDDYESATGAGLEFVFVAGDSEWREGRAFCQERGLRVIDDFVIDAHTGVERSLRRVRVGPDGTALVDGEVREFGRSLAGAVVTV